MAVEKLFELDGHPDATTAYGWRHENDDGRMVTNVVLGIKPLNSPRDSVGAAVVAEIRLKMATGRHRPLRDGNVLLDAPPVTAWFMVALFAAIAFYLAKERDKGLFLAWGDQVQRIPPLAIILFALAMILIARLD